MFKYKLLFFIIYAGSHSASIINNVANSVQLGPNIIELNLTSPGTIKEVLVFSSNSTIVGQISQNVDVTRSEIPPRSYCGFQHTDDREYTEKATAIDEFPWLVDIIHHSNISVCPGVLITRRFVLTGYGCAFFSNKVRLGVYHTRETITCVDVNECSDPVLEISLEKQIYTNVKGDMALLKLVGNLEYTDFIRPICLPLDEAIRPKQGDTLFASGWGKNLEDGTGNAKKRLLFDLKTPEQCKALHPSVELLKKDEFCFTSQEKRNDIGCIDDYGGPIMYKDGHQWFLEGIVIESYTRNRTHGYCSDGITPIYGKKITTEIIHWIWETVGS